MEFVVSFADELKRGAFFQVIGMKNGLRLYPLNLMQVMLPQGGMVKL